MLKQVVIIMLIVHFLLPFHVFSSTLNTDKPRLLVLTDIGGDPDDIQSLRRLLVYSNEFRIEGLIATATWGGKGVRRQGVYYIFDNLIFDALNDFELVRENLLLHAKGYPTADELRAIVKGGQTNRGVYNLLPGLSTSGSNHIIKMVDASDEILHIVIWGGAHDLAQALLDVKTTRNVNEIEKFLSKIRVYAIGDQDKKFTPKGTGEWIMVNFPTLRYLEESDIAQGMFQNDIPMGNNTELPLVKPGLELLNNTEWVQANVSAWGPLGANYPDNVNQNPGAGAKRNSKGVKEGDTPSWFYVLPHGLNDPEHPEWGGWGGRYVSSGGALYTDAQDDHWSGEMDGKLRMKWTMARWREAYQNDFAARMRWCVLPYKEANHNPVVIVDGDKTRNILTRQVQAGKSLKINAVSSYDPDGNKLAFRWWIYHEASTSNAIIENTEENSTEIEIPKSAPEGDVHVILEVTDDGNPGLWAYRRVILKVMHDK